ncbi:MAG: oligosaccharide flippase family protein [Thermodesulfobacteriota bacterium]
MFKGLQRVSFARLKGTLTGRVLVNAGWASGATPITVGLGIIQTGMMARMLGPGGMGTIALFVATCAIVSSLFKLNNAQIALVYVTKALTECDTAQVRHLIRYCYRIDVLSSILSFAIVTILSLVIPQYLNLSPGQENLQIIYGLTLIFQSCYSTSLALLRVADKFSWAFYQSVIHSLIKLAFIAVLYINHSGLSEVVWVLVFLSLFDGALIYLLAKKAMNISKIDVRPKRMWWQVSRNVRVFQTIGYGSGFIKTIYRYLDVILLGFLTDIFSVGIFRAASQLTGLFDIPTQALVTSLTPEYSRLWFNGEVRQLKTLVLRFTFALISIFGVLAAIMFVFGDLIIQIIFGTEFLPAKKPLLIMILASMVGLATSPLNSLQIATGKAWPAMLSGLAGLLIQGTLLLLLVPRTGVSGAAWAKLGGIVVAVAVILPSSIRRLNATKNSDYGMSRAHIG